jgi:hypothetical protein
MKLTTSSTSGLLLRGIRPLTLRQFHMRLKVRMVHVEAKLGSILI